MKWSMEYLTAACRHKPIGVMAIMTCGRAAITARPMMGDRNMAAAAATNTAMAPLIATPVRRQTGIIISESEFFPGAGVVGERNALGRPTFFRLRFPD
jgi:hypothetical protein